MAAITIDVNGKKQTVQVDPDTPLLWVLRDTLGLTGTKFGCGMSLCGACTVHVNGEAIRSCITPKQFPLRYRQLSLNFTAARLHRNRQRERPTRTGKT